ncbi:hypothetical protein PT285_04500 [Lactobacillus sp. ESL0791]|uniref:hypothetical protein n=1 Tax=Lactobacillus sp. ESL0791 TaxID=2983234 RepID=UPI0023F6E6E1|nr:hypothetical protein [Lactobacillus sp. ESL0791]MDF7638658.1 hypothetical protein [Lactobacillus sp. ESL0791]
MTQNLMEGIRPDKNVGRRFRSFADTARLGNQLVDLCNTLGSQQFICCRINRCGRSPNSLVGVTAPIKKIASHFITLTSYGTAI